MEFKKIIEDLKLDSTIFTEEVVDKMTVIMETQLDDAKSGIEQELDEKYKAELAEYKDYLETNLDNYLSEWVEEWVEENEQQIEESVKVRTAQKVLETFNGIVQDFNIQLSEDSVSDGIETDDLKEKLNRAINDKFSLQEEIQEVKTIALIEVSSRNIAILSEKEKFKELAEGLSFEDDETFVHKLKTLRETVETATEFADDVQDEEDNINQNAPIQEATRPTQSGSKAEIMSYLQ